jgi:DNA-binding transcriptional regulator YiaG
MSTKKVDTITPAQSRAARALLEITQSELADAAKLGLSTVVDFEKKRRQVSTVAMVAIRDALAGKGVEFIDENGGGPGVRLRTRQHRKKT